MVANATKKKIHAGTYHAFWLFCTALNLSSVATTFAVLSPTVQGRACQITGSMLRDTAKQIDFWTFLTRVGISGALYLARKKLQHPAERERELIEKWVEVEEQVVDAAETNAFTTTSTLQLFRQLNPQVTGSFPAAFTPYFLLMLLPSSWPIIFLGLQFKNPELRRGSFGAFKATTGSVTRKEKAALAGLTAGEAIYSGLTLSSAANILLNFLFNNIVNANNLLSAEASAKYTGQAQWYIYIATFMLGTAGVVNERSWRLVRGVETGLNLTYFSMQLFTSLYICGKYGACADINFDVADNLVCNGVFLVLGVAIGYVWGRFRQIEDADIVREHQKEGLRQSLLGSAGAAELSGGGEVERASNTSRRSSQLHTSLGIMNDVGDTASSDGTSAADDDHVNWVSPYLRRAICCG